jgi:hypothetical protein
MPIVAQIIMPVTDGGLRLNTGMISVMMPKNGSATM